MKTQITTILPSLVLPSYSVESGQGGPTAEYWDNVGTCAEEVIFRTIVRFFLHTFPQFAFMITL